MALTKMRALYDLGRGVKEQPKKLALQVFSSFSMAFTVIRAVDYFFPSAHLSNVRLLAAVLAGCVIYGFYEVWKPSSISWKIATCDTEITVLFGDLFEQDGLKAIAVNEFFDSELGKPVSDRSVHGIFLRDVLGGFSGAFDAQVAQQLAGIQPPPHHIPAKSAGKQYCYPVGTTALITVNADKYIVFALAKTEPDTCKAFSDVELMWRALHDLWQRVRSEAGDYPISLPLVGSGLSGLNLPTRDILNLIILSAITETKARKITSQIRIVLRQDRFKQVDLRDVKDHWKE